MGNILKSELDRTCAEFLERVYGPRSKPCTEAVKTMFASVLTRSSTLVKELSAPLRTDNGKLEVKRVQEMVSRWLWNYDLDKRLNPYLLDSSAGLVGDRTTLAIDFSDISKEFGGAGMEGMEEGWDGSRGCVAMGHDFISVSMLADLDFRKTHLNTYRGAMRSEVRCAVGVMQYCADPHSKNAPVRRTSLLVVESRFDRKSIYLYVVWGGGRHFRSLRSEHQREKAFRRPQRPGSGESRRAFRGD